MIKIRKRPPTDTAALINHKIRQVQEILKRPNLTMRPFWERNLDDLLKWKQEKHALNGSIEQEKQD